VHPVPTEAKVASEIARHDLSSYASKAQSQNSPRFRAEHFVAPKKPSNLLLEQCAALRHWGNPQDAGRPRYSRLPKTNRDGPARQLPVCKANLLT
jgi:hypothetical protein